jgi:tape measure domain-containing protein
VASSDVIVRLRMQGAQVFSAQASVAAKNVENIGDSAKRSEKVTSGAFDRMAGVLRTGAFALGAVGAAATAMGVKYDMGMEQSKVAFTQFLGSGKRADAMIARLQKLNRATPFEFPELADTTKKLLAMGFNAKDAVKQTEGLADAIAGIGGGGPELQRASLAIGQISTKGKLSAEDLMQLTELGIVGMGDLAKQFDMTGGQFAKAMSKGEIGSEEALKAINKITDSKFGGAAAKQSKTFAGQLSNLKDSASMLLGEAMLPLFEYLRTQAMPAISKAMPTIKVLATTLGVTLVKALKGVGVAVKFMADNWATIKDVAVQLSPLLVVLASYVTIMKVVTAATALWNAVLAINPVVLIIAAVIGLGVALVIAYKKVAWFRNGVDAAFKWIKTAIVNVWNWLKANWPKLAAVLAGPFGIAVLLIAKNWGKIKAGASAVIGWFKGFGHKLVQAIADGIKGASEIILGALRWVIDKLPMPGVLKGKLKDVLGFATGGVMPHTGMAVVGERGPELLQLPGGARVTPLPSVGNTSAPAIGGDAGALARPIVTQVWLDRRQIASAVADDTADRKARR